MTAIPRDVAVRRPATVATVPPPAHATLVPYTPPTARTTTPRPGLNRRIGRLLAAALGPLRGESSPGFVLGLFTTVFTVAGLTGVLLSHLLL